MLVLKKNISIFLVCNLIIWIRVPILNQFIDEFLIFFGQTFIVEQTKDAISLNPFKK